MCRFIDVLRALRTHRGVEHLLVRFSLAVMLNSILNGNIVKGQRTLL